MDKRIIFKGAISSLYIYSEVLNQLSEYYSEYTDHDTVPVFDLTEVEFIEPGALPVIISLGEYLSKFHKRSINLLLLKGSYIVNFLMHTKFLELSKKNHIFAFDEDILNGYMYKPLRDLHRLTFTRIESEYTDVSSILNFVQKRAYIWDNLQINDRVTYQKVLSDTHNLPEKAIEVTLNSIAELKTNAVIYSGSYSYTYVATNKYATYVSIADCGMGFEKSFKDEGRELEIVNSFQDGSNKIFHDFFVIMDALNYSCKKNAEDSRKDLWTLKEEIVTAHNFIGSFKIHYNNTQVIFTTSRCGKCKNTDVEREDISRCVMCLLKDFSNSAFSPIKIFDVGFKGVHVEFTISRG